MYLGSLDYTAHILAVWQRDSFPPATACCDRYVIQCCWYAALIVCLDYMTSPRHNPHLYGAMWVCNCRANQKAYPLYETSTTGCCGTNIPSPTDFNQQLLNHVTSPYVSYKTSGIIFKIHTNANIFAVCNLYEMQVKVCCETHVWQYALFWGFVAVHRCHLYI